MLNMIVSRLFMCVLVAFPGVIVAGEITPSFDCGKAVSDAEKLVCEDSYLALLDRELARVYTLALQDESLDADGKNYLRTFQRGWIKGRDEAWKVKDKKSYVRDVYLLRIAEILNEYPASRSTEDTGVVYDPVHYDCSGTAVKAFHIGPDRTNSVLYVEESPFVLIHEPAASGARFIGTYADGNVEFWSKGKEAVFTGQDGLRLNCREHDS